MRALLCVLTLTALGCAACASAPDARKSRCPDVNLAALEAAFIAEATDACAGKTYDSCPELPAIREKYQAKREEWVRCGQ